MDGLQPITALVTQLASPWLPEYDSFRHNPLGQSVRFDYNKSDKPQTDSRMVMLMSALLLFSSGFESSFILSFISFSFALRLFSHANIGLWVLINVH